MELKGDYLFLASLIGFGALAVTFTIIWAADKMGGFSFDDGETFPWHPVSMVTGMLFMPLLGASSFRLLPFQHDTNKLIHLILMGSGLAMASFGLWAVLQFHSDKGYVDFYSLHSWMGIGTFTLFALQFLSAFVLYFWPKGSVKLRTTLMPYHVIAGFLLIALGASAMITGIMESLTFLNNTDRGCHERTWECYCANIDSLFILICLGILIAYVVFYPPEKIVKFMSKSEKQDRQKDDQKYSPVRTEEDEGKAEEDNALVNEGGVQEEGVIAAEN